MFVKYVCSSYTTEMIMSEQEIIPTQEPEPAVEDMYWIVFRYITLTHRYEPVDVATLVTHLRRNGVLSDDDTEQTVFNEIMGWASAIEEDAGQLNRRGKVVYLEKEDAIVFAALGVSDLETQAAQKRQKSIAQKAISTVTLVMPDDESPTAVEKPPLTLDDMSEELRQTLHLNPEAMVRQAELKRMFIGKYETTEESVQQFIDQLCAEHLYKKVRKQNAVWLRLDNDEEPDENTVVLKAQKQFENEMNAGLMMQILTSLSGPRLHVQQRFTISELWKLIDGKGQLTAEQEQILKKQCRLLSKLGLVEVGQVRQRRGSNLSRSASHHVFKVGLASQDVKQSIDSMPRDTDAFHAFLSQSNLSSK